jgi:FkbM family methyltransferase
MKNFIPFDNMNNPSIGTGRWLLEKTKGDGPFDRFILNLIKLSYVFLRILFRIMLGKVRRDKLWNDRKITFHSFLYKAIEFLRLENHLLLVFDVPKHNFKFNTRITRKVNNLLIHDVVKGMSFHEEELIKQFTPKTGDVVIDVGAAFGLYTILASKKVGITGKVFAIDPQPDTFKMLNKNIKLNKLKNVTSLNCAIHSTETRLKLYSNYSIIGERAGKNNSDFIVVNCNTLDKLVFQSGEIKEVNWIKIDVEGAELEVLKSAHNILQNSKDIAILIEIHNISNGENHYDQIIELLAKYNFKVEFEKIYDNGERNIIVRKQQQL